MSIPVQKGDIVFHFRCPVCGEPIPVVLKGLQEKKDGNTTEINVGTISLVHKCKPKEGQAK